METIPIERLEVAISQLTFREQVRLLEKLAHQIGQKTEAQQDEKQLEAMALDPEMQAELRAIEAEFSGVEGDGLEND